MARRRRSIARGSAGGAAKQLTATSADGCPITAYEEGSGPVTVIIAGGGLDDGRGYARLAARLKSTNRVVRLTRRGYRTDVARWRPVEVKDETADVVALARAVGRPCYVVGHSAGGVEALEAALAAPECFDAIAVFEPAVDAAELPLGDPSSIVAARRALHERRPGRALEIFLGDMVGVPPPAAKLAGLLALAPRFPHWSGQKGGRPRRAAARGHRHSRIRLAPPLSVPGARTTAGARAAKRVRQLMVSRRSARPLARRRPS